MINGYGAALAEHRASIEAVANTSSDHRNAIDTIANGFTEKTATISDQLKAKEARPQQLKDMIDSQSQRVENQMKVAEGEIAKKRTETSEWAERFKAEM